MVFNVLRIFNIIMYRDKDEFKSLTNQKFGNELKILCRAFYAIRKIL